MERPTGRLGIAQSKTGASKCLVKEKWWLLTKKSNNGYPFSIEKSDIVKLVGLAWNKSFARKETNKKAIAARGWNPLNYNVLLHPEIQLSKCTQDSAIPSATFNLTSTILPSDLNLTQGLARNFDGRNCYVPSNQRCAKWREPNWAAAKTKGKGPMLQQQPTKRIWPVAKQPWCRNFA